MGGISSSTTVYILLLFVGVYVFSISSYTYISSLSNVDLWQKRQNDLQLIRLKRDYVSTAVDNWTQNISFNICCAKNQTMNEKLKCVEADRGDFAEKFEGILENFVVDENMTKSFINSSRVFLTFNNSHLLSSDTRFVVHWSPTEAASHYISQKDGSLLQFKERLSQFSSSSFCLDRINNTERNFVVIVNPCEEKMCLQKCCPEGSYYNTAENKCLVENANGMTGYTPTFFDNITETETNISYFLIQGVPKCFGPDTQIKIHENRSPIYIQTDGYLMTNDESEKFHYFYDSKKYCVDMFSDGAENTTQVNGFYCRNDTMLKFPYKTGFDTSYLEPNAMKNNLPEETTPKENIGNLMDIGDAINKAGRKIGEVEVRIKQGANEARKKAVSGLSNARSSAGRFAGSLILGIIFLVKCVC